MLAGGALVGAVTALLGGPLALQVILALVTSVALLGLLRPNIVRRLHSGPDLRTGAEALIGKRATVLRELAPRNTRAGEDRRRGVDRRAL